MFRPVSNQVGHDDHSYRHVMEEIIQHAIWHKVAHVAGLSGFAVGILGSLLSSQSLGEKDVYYIPQPISTPRMAKCMNLRRTMMDDCLILSNGREVIGQDLIRFAQDLQAAQVLTHWKSTGGL